MMHIAHIIGVIYGYTILSWWLAFKCACTSTAYKKCPWAGRYFHD